MTMTNADSYASIAARERHVPRGLANTHAIFVDRAEGTRVWDIDGKEYLDFTSGIGVLNTGHRHPAVVRAVRNQLDRLMHTCFQVTMYEPYVELAARLSALVGSADTHKAVLFTTGAEAIENAVKIARAHTRRSGVIAFNGGFHGRSLLALTMTASSPADRQNFGPFAADVYHTPYPDEYHGWTTARAIEALDCDAVDAAQHGGLENLCRISRERNSAVTEQYHPVGGSRCQVQVVRCHQHRDLLFAHQPAQKLAQLDLVAQIEKGAGLVQQQRRRFLHKASADKNTLPLPAG